MKFTFLLSALFFISFKTYSQNISNVTFEELQMNYYELDSNAGAVVLKETMYFDNNKTIKEEKVYVKIKILSEEYTSYGSETIHLGKEQNIEDLKAVAYNLENNQVISNTLQKELIYTIDYKEDKYVKFTIPNVKKGSVIEYSYTLFSSYIHLPHWKFQRTIPVKYSELEFRSMPLSFGYEKKSRFQFDVEKNDNTNGNYKWVVKNVPGFKGEDFVANEEDYLAGIDFYFNPPTDIETGWKELTSKLNKNGYYVKSNVSFLSKEIERIKKENKDSLSMLKACYNFIKDSLTSAPSNNIKTGSLKAVYSNRVGTVAEVNLLLCFMLQELGFKSIPILSSSKYQGRVFSDSYPHEKKLTHLLAYVKVKGVSYYLDASSKLRPFNFSPSSLIECDGLEGNTDVLKWHKIAGSQQSQNSWIVNLNIQNNGVITGNCVISKSGYFALEDREEIQNAGIEEFKKSFYTYIDFASLENVKVDNIKTIEKNLLIGFDFVFDDTIGVNKDRFLLSAVWNKLYSFNPMNQNERVLPIDFDYPKVHQFRLNIKYPPNIEVYDLPTDLKIADEKNDLAYQFSISKPMPNMVSVYDNFTYRNSFYPSSKYAIIQTILGKMILKQNDFISIKIK